MIYSFVDTAGSGREFFVEFGLPLSSVSCEMFEVIVVLAKSTGGLVKDLPDVVADERAMATLMKAGKVPLN